MLALRGRAVSMVALRGRAVSFFRNLEGLGFWVQGQGSSCSTQATPSPAQSPTPSFHSRTSSEVEGVSRVWRSGCRVPHGGARSFHQTSTCLAQLISGPYMVQIWSRNTPESRDNEILRPHRVIGRTCSSHVTASPSLAQSPTPSFYSNMSSCASAKT